VTSSKDRRWGAGQGQGERLGGGGQPTLTAAMIWLTAESTAAGGIVGVVNVEADGAVRAVPLSAAIAGAAARRVPRERTNAAPGSIYS